VTVVAKVVIMKQPKLTSMRFLQAGERVRLADHLAYKWVDEGLADWPDEAGPGASQSSPSPAGGQDIARAIDLSKMRKPELLALAVSIGVEKADTLKVADLIDAIKAARGGEG
jgi:hypothetical protein